MVHQRLYPEARTRNVDYVCPVRRPTSAGICACFAGSLLFSSCAERPDDPIIAAATTVIDVVAPPRSVIRSVTLAVEVGAEGDSRAFGGIGGVAAAASGDFYVQDFLSDSVFAYRRDGTPIRSFGGKGEGPGELDMPTGVVVTGDTVVVDDVRFHAFRVDGEYLATSRNSAVIPYMNLLGAGDSGLVMARMRRGEVRSNSRLDSIVFYSFRLPGTIRPIFSIPERYFVYEKYSSYPTALRQGLLFTVHANGEMALAVGDSFHINVYGPGGDLRRTYIAAVPRTPVSDTDVKDFRRSIEAYALMRGRITITAPNFAKIGPIATDQSVIGALVGSDTGDLLVQMFSASERPYDRFRYDASSRWLLLREDGSAKMTFDLPRTFVPEVVRACSVYGVYTNGDNVQSVRRYDLAPVCRTREPATSSSTRPEAAPRLPAT